MTTWNCLFHTRLLAVNMGLHLLVLVSSYFTAGCSGEKTVENSEESKAWASLHFAVELRLPRFVPLNGSAMLRCDYDVPLEILHKVEWLRGGEKMYQFVRNRKPPFRLYTVTGAVIDRNKSNEREIFLKELQLDASGYYSCEVSTETPIFTKTSNDEELAVIQPQRGAPLVHVRQPAYLVGELLEANCTSRPAHPVPHVTWLLNGDTVPESYLKLFPNQQQNEGENLSSTTVQLTMPVQFTHAGADNRMHLACVATIPAFMGLQATPAQYADYQREDASVEVLQPEIPSGQERLTTFIAPYVFLLILGCQRYLQWR